MTHNFLAKFIATSLFVLLDRSPESFDGKQKAEAHQQFLLTSAFISKILKITCKTISLPMVLIALKLVDRMTRNSEREIPRMGSEAYVFIVALLLAQKTCADHCYTNGAWSKISGIPSAVLGKMEVEFLKSIDYHLLVTDVDYRDWYLYIQQLAQMYDGPVATTPRINTQKRKRSCSSEDDETFKQARLQDQACPYLGVPPIEIKRRFSIEPVLSPVEIIHV